MGALALLLVELTEAIEGPPARRDPMMATTASDLVIGPPDRKRL
jgi:hypothetical protein